MVYSLILHASRYHGGWVCPNIYFLGHSGVVQFGGLRIGGISGIFNDRDYHQGRHYSSILSYLLTHDIMVHLGYFETVPYNQSSKRSIYHTREIEIFKMAQVNNTDSSILDHLLTD